MKKHLLSLVTLVTMASTYAQTTYQTQNANIPLLSAGIREFSIVNENIAWTYFYDGSGSTTYPRYVALTTNGGTNWTSKLISNLPASTMISDLHAVNATTAFIVNAPHTSTANGLWKTTDGGTTWSKINGVFGTASFANIVYIWPNGTGLAIGDPVSNKYEMYKTTDNGTTWSVVTTAPIPDNADEYGYVGGKVINGNNIWLTSNTGRIFHSPDQGTTWNSYYTPLADFGGADSSASMAFSSSTDGLIVDNFSTLWYTNDSGADWNIKESANYYDGDIKYIPGTVNSYMTTGISQNSLLGTGSARSNDGGNTWVTIDSGNELDLKQRGNIGAYNNSTIYVGHFTSSATGTGGILKLNTEELATSNQDLAKVELKAVVNNGLLSLVSNKDIKSVLLIDITGKKIKEVNSKEANVSELKSGVYVARVAYNDGAFGTVKFAIK